MNASEGTPDYLNACAPYNSYVNVPNTGGGYQAARTGDAFVGLYFYLNKVNQTYREYLECKLNQPLIAGHKYYTSFYANLSTWDATLGLGIGSEGYNSNAIDSLGVNFSDTLVHTLGYYLTVPMQVSSPAGQFITDTIGWTKVHGIYTAAGGEQWLTLGRSYCRDDLPFITVLPGIMDTVAYGGYSYYYIDDVCVFDLSGPALAIADTTICVPSFPYAISGQSPGDDYLWSTGESTETISINSEGVYWRQSFGDCSVRSDTIRVKKVETITDDSILCYHNEPTALTSSVSGNHTWNTGSNNDDIVVEQPGVYWCVTRNGCKLNIDTFDVQVKPALELGNDTSICLGEKIILGFAGITASYLWNTGSTECCISPGKTGIYSLAVNNGCGSASDSISVSIYPCHDCIFMPDAFTPNNDGLNDEINPLLYCPSNHYEFSIFNRWGQVVFKTTNSEIGWNGRYNGQDAEVGVYYYMIIYTPAFASSGQKILKGDITLVR